jgi:membrane-associated phospholipid phosphatase
MKDMDGLLKKTAVMAGITAFTYLVLFYFVDKPIDIYAHNYLSKTFLLPLGTYISFLAKGDFVKLALAFCFILIIVCDPGIKWRWTRYLLYICITGSIAIIIGEGFKYLLGRYRPIMFFKHNLYGMHFFSSEWALNSTPSGHTIRAFSLLTAASLLCKRFTVVFIAIATVIGASRVIVTAHYPSDVLFGGFIGIFTAAWTYKYFFLKTDTLERETSRPN